MCFLCDVEGRSFRGFRKRVFNLRAVYSAQRRSAIGVRDVFVSVREGFLSYETY